MHNLADREGFAAFAESQSLPMAACRRAVHTRKEINNSNMINTLYNSSKLSQFKLKSKVPQDLIAAKPYKQRDTARMMVLNSKTGAIEHKLFKNLVDYLDEEDLVVLNNTRVFPSRLKGEKEKTGASIIVWLLRELNPDTYLWDVIVDPARKIRIGNKLYFGDNDSLVAEVIDNTTSRGRAIRFLFDGTHDELIKTLRSIGQSPLPEEILEVRGTKDPAKVDLEDYQTIFAKVEGAAAAPITGLHVSRELLTRLEIKGVRTTELTLHCGIGNFNQIEVEDLSKHRQDSEEMHLSEESCDLINRTKQNNHRICAIGCSVLKALETAVTIPGKIAPFDGWTNKFVFPPYEFSMADMMVSNFMTPGTPQFIMVCTFGSNPDLVVEAYNTAIKEKYRFGTYGDSLLII